jgi:putative oxidoreductase
MSTIDPAAPAHPRIASPDDRAIASAVCLLGRLMISALFLISGIGKITAPAATIAYIAAFGLPFPQLGLAVGIAVELVLGPALVLGYRTRLVAAVLAVYCVASAFIFHHAFADSNQFLHFFKNIGMAGGLLQVVVFGGGRFSLDERLRRSAESQ